MREWTEDVFTQVVRTILFVRKLNFDKKYNHVLGSKYKSRSLFTLATCRIRHWNGLQLYVVCWSSPLLQCSMPMTRPWNTTREKKRHLHKVWMVRNDLGGCLARKNAKIPQVGKVNNYRNPFLESRVLEVIIWSFFSFSLFLQPRFNCYPKIFRYRRVSQREDYIFQEQQQSLSV
jgi:hypothetical protein